jgi:hypothetical protein
MTEVKDGGPAFPGAELPAHPDHPTGMSLRDWFAGQANEEDILQHMGWTYGVAGVTGSRFTREQARYKFANAMLAARGQP